LRFQGVLHPHAPRRFRLRFPAPRGRVRKCRRGSCSGIRRSEKRRVVLSATLDRSSLAAHSYQFLIVVLGRCSRKNCMKWTTHCPSPLTSSSVAGHTNTSVVSPGGRLKSPGYRDLCKRRIGPRPTKPPPTCIPRRRRSSLPRAGRRGRPSTWFPSTIRIGRIGRNSPIGPAPCCGKMIGERARETEKMAATGNFESPLALSFAH
jgi:hypothetical protein